eukprot:CAMPEP_0174246012 /NCGR_PEP_ID=MMETSP0417-20130205/41842_1 /TAXON_ID=242541 /ORGANISM="Mayorella sp, Strain BSH-02190019" /LENGTH=80 /DNA_ID=CAMNT_0015325861 /DNA_START=1 /DNA_END=243 /DNA_ORIENTATION=-
MFVSFKHNQYLGRTGMPDNGDNQKVRLACLLSQEDYKTTQGERTMCDESHIELVIQKSQTQLGCITCNESREKITRDHEE